MQLDLGNILQQSGLFADQATDNANQISGLTTQINDVTSTAVQQARDAGNAAVVKTQIDQAEIARQESARQAIAARLGTDSSTIGWMIGKKADEVKTADDNLSQLENVIRSKQSINPLADPLGWIASKFTIGQDIDNYNAWTATRERASQTATELEKMTTDAFQTNNALSATASAAHTAALSTLAAFQYNQLATKTQIDGARYNMEGILAASNMQRDRLSSLYQANNAIMQEKQYQTEVSRLRLSEAEFGLRKQQFALASEAHDEKFHEDSLILKYIQSGFQNLKGRTMDDASAREALILYKNKQPDVMNWFESGLQSSGVTGGTSIKPVINLSPYKVATMVGKGQVENLSPAMKQVTDSLVSWRRDFESPAVQNQFPYDPKDPNSKEIAFNKFVENKRQALTTNVTEGSIYAPQDLRQTTAVNKNLASLPVWTQVLEPASKAGVNVNDPNVAFGLITSAMKEKKLSYVDAVDVSLLYAGAMEMNNQARNWIAFGMAPTRTYNAAITIPGMIGSTAVNLTDQMKVARALNKAEASRASLGVRGDTMNFGE